MDYICDDGKIVKYKIEEYEDKIFIFIRGWSYLIEFKETFWGEKLWGVICLNGETLVKYGAYFPDKESAKEYIIEHSKYMAEGKMTQKEFGE